MDNTLTATVVVPRYDYYELRTVQPHYYDGSVCRICNRPIQMGEQFAFLCRDDGTKFETDYVDGFFSIGSCLSHIDTADTTVTLKEVDSHVFAHVAGGLRVGSCYLRGEGIGKSQIEFWSFWVHEPFRGQGIGKMILDYVKDKAAKRGAPIWLRVYKSNPAKHLYDRAGFVVTSDHPDSDHYTMMWYPNG